MPDSLAIETAAALADALNNIAEQSGAFSIPFTAELIFDPFMRDGEELDTDTLRQMRVTCSATVDEAEVSSRIEWQHDITCGVAVQKAIEPPHENTDELRRLSHLCDEIVTHVKKLRRLGDATLVGVERNPMWNPQHLRQNKVFTSVINLTFRRHVETLSYEE